MGFFSDLKDDLSQAVSGDNKADKMTGAADKVEETAAFVPEPTFEDTFSNADLSDILDKIEVENGSELVVEDLDKEVVDEPVEATPVAPVVNIPTPQPSAPFVNNAYVEPVSSSRIAADEVSVIMDSMIINGNMATEGSLEIRGSVVGNVECLGKLNITGSVQGNSSAAEVFADGAKINGEVKSMGSIKVGQSTTIIGNVFATSAVVAGAIKGDIDVKGPVILDSTAIVLGNIKSKAVQINNGAVIEGVVSQCYAEVNPKSFFEELKKMK